VRSNCACAIGAKPETNVEIHSAQKTRLRDELPIRNFSLSFSIVPASPGSMPPTYLGWFERTEAGRRFAARRIG
jgi:hypothetical protein